MAEPISYEQALIMQNIIFEELKKARDDVDEVKERLSSTVPNLGEKQTAAYWEFKKKEEQKEKQMWEEFSFRTTGFHAELEEKVNEILKKK